MSSYLRDGGQIEPRYFGWSSKAVLYLVIKGWRANRTTIFWMEQLKAVLYLVMRTHLQTSCYPSFSSVEPT